MARLPRFVIPGQAQHVIVRGNNRTAIFRAGSDYSGFLQTLYESCQKHDCVIHAYALMTNHVHLLATPGHESSLPKTIQSVGRRYVQYFNWKYGRTGTLWEGRYRATLIDSEVYLMTCMRYIELNPVRAGMVNHPSGHPWSSYRANAHGTEDKLVTPHEQYCRLGLTLEDRLCAYRGLFAADIPPETLSDIREASNKAWVLGSDSFKQRVQQALGRRVKPGPRGARQSREE